jgi:hypothetical protein
MDYESAVNSLYSLQTLTASAILSNGAKRQDTVQIMREYMDRLQIPYDNQGDNTYDNTPYDNTPYDNTPYDNTIQEDNTNQEDNTEENKHDRKVNKTNTNRNIKIIHITGTKGKGSTSAFTEVRENAQNSRPPPSSVV